ncbi:Merozoite receptor PK66 [Babesia sp. Xinjiang]|uniref:AMA1 n=1 Tax=Babesia sp. TaxID=35084 RepID=A0A7D5D204_9APIC|nr:Merozoite receptor PK66 [Babesia sp. Xinjiang]ORM39595.1 Merozoite receptor PK66 [Babesia sp. Xinjiang]QKY59677.1 AMA1 [Babesia sp.]
MQTPIGRKPAFMSKLYLAIVPIILSTLLLSDALASKAALVAFQRDPSSSRGSRRSSRRDGQSSRRSADGESEAPERVLGRSSSKASSQTPWTKYMQRFDIPRVHGSGIFVDLGGSETVNRKSYRMPIGKCPVMGKVIELANGADYLDPISSEDPSYRGLAFPETAVENPATTTTAPRGRSRSQPSSVQLSPVAASDLRRWGYTGNDVANCAEYASNIVPNSDKLTKYRYPFVFDGNEEMCYILFSAMQYNQGSRYCDNDGSADEGSSSLLCMRPYKSTEDANLYYGSARLDHDWEENCPMHPVRDALFGKWVSGSCVALTPAFQEYVNTFEECSALLFENSSTDIDINVNRENYNELDELYSGIKRLDLSRIATALFSPLATTGGTSTASRGVGMNWANYDSDSGLCRILNEIPNCLIISAGSMALTAIGSPLEKDAIDFPCNIDTNGYIEPRTRSINKYSDAPFEVSTALSTKTLKCSGYIHSKYSDSCGTYYYCSDEKPGYFRRFLQMLGLHTTKRVIIAGTVSLVTIGLIYWICHRFFRAKETTKHYDAYMGNYEYDDPSDVNNEAEQRLSSDAYIWGEATSRPSDVTPVHLTKIG